MRNRVIVLIACLWLSLANAATTTPPKKILVTEGESLGVETAVAMALEDNPGLAAIRARAEALALVPVQRQSLPEPRLSVNVLNLPVDSFSFSREGMTQLQLAISQPLPFPGRLALRADIASVEAAMGEKETAESRLSLQRDVRISWWRMFALDRAL